MTSIVKQEWIMADLMLKFTFAVHERNYFTNSTGYY